MPSPKKLMIMSALLGVLGLGGFSTGLPAASLVTQACASNSTCDPSVPNCCTCLQCRQDQDGDGICAAGTSQPKCGIACPAGWRQDTSCNTAGPDCNDSLAYDGTTNGSGYIPAVACDPSTATTTANCHTSTYQRPDGNCGQNTCPANAPSSTNCSNLPCHTNTQSFLQSDCTTLSCGSNAPAYVACSSLPCHTGTQYVSDGNCGTYACPSNAPAYQACASGCSGQSAQNLPDGSCGTHSCAATPSCSVPGISVGGWNNDGTASVAVYASGSCINGGQTYYGFNWIYTGSSSWYVSYYGAYPGASSGWTTATAWGLSLAPYSTPCGCYYYFSDSMAVGGPNCQQNNATGMYCLTSNCTTH